MFVSVPRTSASPARSRRSPGTPSLSPRGLGGGPQARGLCAGQAGPLSPHRPPRRLHGGSGGSFLPSPRARGLRALENWGIRLPPPILPAARLPLGAQHSASSRPVPKTRPEAPACVQVRTAVTLKRERVAPVCESGSSPFLSLLKSHKKGRTCVRLFLPTAETRPAGARRALRSAGPGPRRGTAPGQGGRVASGPQLPRSRAGGLCPGRPPGSTAALGCHLDLGRHRGSERQRPL